MTRFRTIVQRIAHVAALLVCAWWLVATSSDPEPPRECFTGLGDAPLIRQTAPTSAGRGRVLEQVAAIATAAIFTALEVTRRSPDGRSRACRRWVRCSGSPVAFGWTIGERWLRRPR